MPVVPRRLAAIPGRRMPKMPQKTCGDAQGRSARRMAGAAPGRLKKSCCKPSVNQSALYRYSRFCRERRSMPHSIAVWQAVISTARSLLLLAKGMAEDELPPVEEGDVVLAELCRQYPGLSRDIAEYLAR